MGEDVFMRNGKPNKAPVHGSRIDAEAAWKQVQARDAKADFFYAVVSTGVFCRPGCASRRPLRDNVRFFRTAAEARAAGFRACARCRPDAARVDLMEKIRMHLEAHADRRVSLAELGRLAGMSPYTVQRRFKQEMGVSPLAYQRGLRAGRLRRALKKGETVTNAIYEAGFGAPSRVYEDAQLGMTPARFAQGGRGERIGFATARTSFGWIVAGATERGLCWLALADTSAAAEATLREEFPEAEVRRDPSLAKYVDGALEMVDRRAGRDITAQTLTQLDLRGTAFQLRVWQALRQIPRGETRTYSQVARELGDAKATRAVARACAMNRVSLMVPCHRVVGVAGSLTGYRWGTERKRQLLEAERKA